jgi:hypothetical protein
MECCKDHSIVTCVNHDIKKEFEFNYECKCWLNKYISTYIGRFPVPDVNAINEYLRKKDKEPVSEDE